METRVGDQRIAAILALIPPSSRLIDVGTDHGKIAMGAARRPDIGRVLATDISPASLSKLEEARAHLPEAVASKLETQVADGLQDLVWDQADTVVICGMGGLRILQILQEGAAFLAGTRYLILGPQSQVADVRAFFLASQVGLEEVMAEEGGKFYPLLRVDRAGQPSPDYRAKVADPLALEYGPQLLQEKDSVLKRCLLQRQQSLAWILRQMADGAAGVEEEAGSAAVGAADTKDEAAAGAGSEDEAGAGQARRDRQARLTHEARWIEDLLAHWEEKGEIDDH